jgi:hypothetical protein
LNIYYRINNVQSPQTPTGILTFIVEVTEAQKLNIFPNYTCRYEPRYNWHSGFALWTIHSAVPNCKYWYKQRATVIWLLNSSSYTTILLLFLGGGGVTGDWTQGLNLEPLCQSFAKGFFTIGSHRTICLGWLRTMILLISASWVASITGVLK